MFPLVWGNGVVMFCMPDDMLRLLNSVGFLPEYSDSVVLFYTRKQVTSFLII